MKRRIGPILHLREADATKWRFSIGLWLDDTGQKPPTVRLPKQANASISPLASATGMFAGAKWMFWNVTIPRRASEFRTSYDIDGLDEGTIHVDDVVIPALGHSPRVSFFSCNGVQDPKDWTTQPEMEALWKCMHERHKANAGADGRGRFVAVPPGLASMFIDVMATRRREALARGWPEVPGWVLPSQNGTPLEEKNFARMWRRLRRRALKHGIRPLKLHCTRHTWASLALASGKSVRWVADQLGHASPALTLKTYAHAMREEEADLSFADFGVGDCAERLYTSPASEVDAPSQNAPDPTGRGRFGNLEHETGLEPATPTLARDEEGEEER